MTRGQRALRRYLAESKRGELVRLAKTLCVSAPTVHGWARISRPRFERRNALERATGGKVRAAFWMTKRERKLWEDLAA